VLEIMHNRGITFVVSPPVTANFQIICIQELRNIMQIENNSMEIYHSYKIIKKEGKLGFDHVTI
jgi:hypothetical protein